MSAVQYPISYSSPTADFKQNLGHGIARYGFFSFVNSDRVTSDLSTNVQSNLPPQLRSLTASYAAQKKTSRKRGLKKKVLTRMLQFLPAAAKVFQKGSEAVMSPFITMAQFMDGKTSGKNELAQDPSWGTATVKTSSLQGDVLWSTSVQLGSSSQTLNVNIDTGSSDFLVFDPSCVTCALASHAAFLYQNSNTFTRLLNLTFDESYADGGEAVGYLAADILDFGGTVQIQNQTFGMATDVSSGWESQAVDGLMGLGPDSLSAFPWPHSQGVFTQLIKEKVLAQPVIGIALVKEAANSSGEFSFGKVDGRWIRGGESQLLWKNVTSQNFWGIELSGIYVNNRNIMVSNDPPRAIVDTGTSLMLVTDSAASAIHAQIPGAVANPSNGIWRLPCSTGATPTSPNWGNSIATAAGSLLGMISSPGRSSRRRHRRSENRRRAPNPVQLSPNIFIELGAGFRKFGIPASDLVYQDIPSSDPNSLASDGKTEMCYSAIQSGADGFFVLGGTFIKNHYIALKQDASGKSIGFGDRSDLPVIL